jgi:uncharacterized membrane protein
MGFAVLEVRVLFHGQIVVATLGATLAELGIHSSICLGIAALLTQAPSSSAAWRREASMAFAALGALIFAVGPCIYATPLLGESRVVGGPIIDNLLVGYALPCLIAALVARGARAQGWTQYASLASLCAIVALFAYASLEIRHLFHGTEMDILNGFTAPELYAYSAAWLALGILLLAYGLWRGSREARLASACFVVAAVVKVFLIDLSGLEGLLRALSFIGLGAVLIGIGLVYQRIVFAPRAGEEQKG